MANFNEQELRAFSKKPKDHTRNSFSIRQIVNTLPFSAYFTKNNNANRIGLTPIFLLDYAIIWILSRYVVYEK